MLNKQFILYSLIGLLCLITELTTFKFFLTFFELNIFIANIFSIYLASLISFTLNGIYNFKKFDHKIKRYIIFVSIIILGSAVSSLLLKLFSYYFSVMIAKTLTIPFVVFLQFLLNKNITFNLKFSEK